MYIIPGFKNYGKYLEKLGKHTNSVVCLYIKKLEDIDKKVLEQIIKAANKDMEKMYPE